MSWRKGKTAYVAHSIFLLDRAALHILKGPSWFQNYILPQNDPQVWTSDDSSGTMAKTQLERKFVWVFFKNHLQKIGFWREILEGGRESPKVSLRAETQFLLSPRATRASCNCGQGCFKKFTVWAWTMVFLIDLPLEKLTLGLLLPRGRGSKSLVGNRA